MGFLRINFHPSINLKDSVMEKGYRKMRMNAKGKAGQPFFRLLNSQLRIENFSEPVPDESKTSYPQHNENTGEDGDPPLTADDVLAAFSDHESPFRSGEFGAESDKA